MEAKTAAAQQAPAQAREQGQAPVAVPSWDQTYDYDAMSYLHDFNYAADYEFDLSQLQAQAQAQAEAGAAPSGTASSSAARVYSGASFLNDVIPPGDAPVIVFGDDAEDADDTAIPSYSVIMDEDSFDALAASGAAAATPAIGGGSAAALQAVVPAVEGGGAAAGVVNARLAAAAAEGGTAQPLQHQQQQVQQQDGMGSSSEGSLLNRTVNVQINLLPAVLGLMMVCGGCAVLGAAVLALLVTQQGARPANSCCCGSCGNGKGDVECDEQQQQEQQQEEQQPCVLPRSHAWALPGWLLGGLDGAARALSDAVPKAGRGGDDLQRLPLLAHDYSAAAMGEQHTRSCV